MQDTLTTTSQSPPVIGTEVAKIDTNFLKILGSSE